MDYVSNFKQRVWDAVKSKAADLRARVMGHPMVQRLMNTWKSIRSKAAELKARVMGHPLVQRLLGVWRGVRTKLETLKARVAGHPMVQRLKSVWDGIRSKLESLKARVSGSGAVAALKGLWDSVRSKTVSLVTKVKKVFSSNADGSVTDYYANGGVRAPVERFAGGGVRRERHVAQIAPAGTYRLWAEQETGGEAYIPLAKAKRSRSEKILSEVAHRFGGEFRKFANGSDHSREVAVGGDNYTVNISTLPGDQADRVANDTLFALKHLRRGGGAGVYA